MRNRGILRKYALYTTWSPRLLSPFSRCTVGFMLNSKHLRTCCNFFFSFENGSKKNFKVKRIVTFNVVRLSVLDKMFSRQIDFHRTVLVTRVKSRDVVDFLKAKETNSFNPKYGPFFLVNIPVSVGTCCDTESQPCARARLTRHPVVGP